MIVLKDVEMKEYSNMKIGGIGRELIKNNNEIQKMKMNLKTFKEGNAVEHIVENLDIWGQRN